MPLQVAVGYASLTGPRERNEDFCGLATPAGQELENKGIIAAVADGIGGFYLASSMGYSKQMTGSYQAGFLIFAALAVLALVGLTGVKTRWRTTWGAAHLTAAKI